ncbi:magnesium transporter MgtE [Candidatus Dependentiae bacterium Noda2021]|nr:magnesium transporter MgtE [Candidatus Dependentiae bacterium Noda2021]
MNTDTIFNEIQQHIDSIIEQSSPFTQELWKQFTQSHPADIAGFFSDINREHFKRLFLMLPHAIKLSVFLELPDSMKVESLTFMSTQERVDALNQMPTDQLTDLFDLFSDEELKEYLVLLNKTEREKVISLLKFDPESAGGIMNTDVITLVEDFTVEKSIQVLQRLQPDRDIHQQIYVTDRSGILVGNIQIEDLVLQPAKTRIGAFMHKNELIVAANQDREKIAKQMIHYGLMIVPVVGTDGQFLGVIPSDILVDILVEEANEDVQKMSALAPMKHPYFETSFSRLLYERGYILIGLLFAQSFSTTIMKSFKSTLQIGSLLYFTNMLISTGGNASNQTSALVIQGFASGEIHEANFKRFIKREILMACVLSMMLGLFAFLRAWWTSASLIECITISLSLSSIVIVAVILGTCTPFLLKRLNIDPAFSAGPFLATLMDILGVLIYCYVSQLILS